MALAIVGGLMVLSAVQARAEDGVACGNCTDLLAIPAIEDVPEHAFGWKFGDPQPFCRLAAGSRLRLDARMVPYRGRVYRKVQVLAGACAGHAGWVPDRETQPPHAGK